MAEPLRLGGWVVVLGALAAAGASLAADKPRETPSGLPVPRYVSLKFDSVNARAGAGDDHRLLWVFHAKGLPVQVVAETDEWRRICDPDGALSWVHKRTTDGARTVIRISKDPAPIRHSPHAGAAIDAYLAPQAPAALDKCENGWCRVHVESVKGWVEAGLLWGVADAPQCR
jgi:SH3-like domain-containing protein